MGTYWDDWRLIFQTRRIDVIRVAKAILLTDEERATLVKWSRGRGTLARLMQRAQIVLAAADGRENKDIAVELGCTRRTVGTWQNRFAAQRLAGIECDAPRAGRTTTQRQNFEAEILRKTTQELPPDATQWSKRSLAKALGCSDSLVQRVWHNHGLKPHRIKNFKRSNDPPFAEKLVDIVGLMLDPPEHALVLSCDEKSSIQALDRTQKSLPLFPGRLKTLTHDYTYVATDEGWLYLAADEDLFTREIVSWSMSDRINSRLVVDALEMALRRQCPGADLVAHSDRGVQFTSEHYQRLLTKHGITCPISRTGNCRDNTPMGSFFATLKRELVHYEEYETRAEASQSLFEYIVFFTTVSEGTPPSDTNHPANLPKPHNPFSSARKTWVSPIRRSTDSIRDSSVGIIFLHLSWKRAYTTSFTTASRGMSI